MDDNSISRSFQTARPSFWADHLAQAAFGGFLVLIVVGFSPFSSSDTLAAGLVATGEGDVVRQVGYVLILGIIFALACVIRGQRVLRCFPLALAVVLLWCFLSISWAIEPGIAVRRAMLCFILASCVMLSVDMLGPQRSLQVVRFVLASVLIVDCVSLLIVPQAVHLPGELESELAGNWRGLHNHKNIAGPIAAMSALLFFHYSVATRRWQNWALFAAAIVFMIGTQSKTAIGFFLVSIVMSSTYRQMARTDMGRSIFSVLFVGALLIATIAWFAFYEDIVDLMSDPTSFTGRVAIWNKVLSYVREHPLLGAGYGSFWGIGETSPAQALNPSEKWIAIIPHSHNGYLEILVTTGIIGLIISVAAFVVFPIKELIAASNVDINLRALLFSWVCFCVFENLLETVFLYRERPEWVMFLIVLAILHQLPATGASAANPSHSSNRRW